MLGGKKENEYRSCPDMPQAGAFSAPWFITAVILNRG